MVFKCRNCGSEITVNILEPGENALCKQCGSYNMVPEPGRFGTEVLVGGIPKDPKLVDIRTGPDIIGSILGPRNIGDIIGEIFTVYFKNFLKIILLYGIAYLPNIGLAYMMFQLFGDPPEITPDKLLPLILSALLVILYNTIVVPIVEAAFLIIICNHYLEEERSIISALRLVIGKSLYLIATSLLVGIAVLFLIITLIGIPFAIYLLICWSLYTQAIVLENLGITDGISRSKRLVDGYWWHCFGTLFFILIILMMPYIGSLFLPWYLRIPIRILLDSIPLVAIPILYFDLRARKEGYNHNMLREDIRRMEIAEETKST